MSRSWVARRDRNERWSVIRTLGRYELIEQVGTGGMATVYRAWDSALDREVAVKLLHPHLADRAESRARFSREARAVARLSHRSIVEIYDYSGDSAAESYLVTELVHGRTLRAWQREVGFGYPEIGLLAGRALAEALAHAHGAGVIHRDLKPENVLVQEGDRPGIKLADFGIARILASEERLTLTGALVGSPQHMAPEIVEGREADARSDLFSLGTLLYWLATGRLPFTGSNPTAVLRRLIEGTYEDPRAADPRVSDRLAALLSRLLAVDPAERPASAVEVRGELDAILAEVGIRQPDEALDAFLRDPPGYTASFEPLAIASLMAHADDAAATGHTARSLAALERILVLAPESRDVRLRLAAITSRTHRRRFAAAAGIAVLVAVLAVGGAAVVRREARVTGGRAEAAPRAPGAWATPSLEPEARAAREVADSGLLPPGAGRGSAAAPSPNAARAAIVPLSIHVRPYAQRALLDNAEVAAGAQIVRFGLRPGRVHVIRIEHACCFPFVKELTAEEAARIGELRVPLEPRPARLRVEGAPTTRIIVDGKELGTAGDSQRAPIDVQLPRGESPYEAAVRVELAPPGAPVRTLSLMLKAGGEAVVAAPQEVLPP